MIKSMLRFGRNISTEKYCPAVKLDVFCRFVKTRFTTKCLYLVLDEEPGTKQSAFVTDSWSRSPRGQLSGTTATLPTSPMSNS